MKKFLSGLIALVLVLSRLSVSALAEPAGITGDWYASFYGIVMMMTLKEDGGYILQMVMEDEESTEGTWAFDGTALVLDQGTDAEMTLAYDPEAVSLSAEVEGMEFLFTREVPAAFEAAPARTDAALEEFAGAWACTLIDCMGMQVAPDVAGLSMNLRIEGSLVAIALPELLGEEAALEGAFADGTLTVTLPTEDESSEDMVFTLQLLEDGTMSVATSMMDMPMVFYMAAEEKQP